MMLVPRAFFAAFGLVASLLLSGEALAQGAGTCVGAAWISGEGPLRDDELGAPDSVVFKFRSTAGPVIVYVGSFSNATGNARTPFATIDGIVVHRVTGQAGFNGYLVEKTFDDGPPAQLHFYGNGLTGDDRDRAFFQRVHFGKLAAERCKRG